MVNQLYVWGAGQHHDSMDKDAVYLKPAIDPLVFVVDWTINSPSGWRVDTNSLYVNVNEPSRKDYVSFEIPDWALQTGEHVVHLPDDIRLLVSVEDVDDSDSEYDECKFARLEKLIFDKPRPWMSVEHRQNWREATLPSSAVAATEK